MNLSFYTATVGAAQQQDRLDVHANNISNVNTYGFRARIPAFSPLMTGPVRGINEQLPRGVGARLEDAEPDFRTRGFSDTGRALDFAIEGDGFFALMDPGTGDLSFTRDGSFTMMQIIEAAEGSEEGEVVWRLSDGNGRYVLSADGQVIEVPTGTTKLMGYEFNVGVFDFVNYNGMLNLSENRLVPVDKNGDVTVGTGKVIQGALELSNADLANELTKVIESQRSFQYLLRMITSSDEIETTVNNLR